MTVAGVTASSNATFPVLNAFQATRAGSYDGFVARLNAAGNALVFSTYVGGSSEERLLDLALTSSGEPVVSGMTFSEDFPVTSGSPAINAGFGGNGYADGFVVRLSATGTSMSLGRLIGCSFSDSADSVAVDSRNDIYITGYTDIEQGFPTTRSLGLESTAREAFVAKYAAGGTLRYATRFGGTADDFGGGIAVDSNFTAYVAGSTLSTGFPLQSPYQSANAGQEDLFVTRITDNSSVTINVSNAPKAINKQFTVTGSGCQAGTYTAPATLTWVVGAPCSVQWTFPPPSTAVRWQDGVFGNPRSFTRSTNTATTLTATYLAI